MKNYHHLMMFLLAMILLVIVQDPNYVKILLISGIFSITSVLIYHLGFVADTKNALKNSAVEMVKDVTHEVARDMPMLPPEVTDLIGMTGTVLRQMLSGMNASSVNMLPPSRIELLEDVPLD